MSRRPTRPHHSAAEDREDHPLSTSSTEPQSAISEDMADDEAEEEEEHVADVKQCLFCNYISPDLDLNITHMSKQHGLFIPEREYLVDLPGLITYLHETIAVLHQCLYCGQVKHTTSGIQTHMRDRGHCMIAYSTEEEQMEIGDFYDFRATYSDASSTAGEEEEQDGGVSLGAKKAVKTTYQNEEGEDVEMADDGEDGWESDSTLSSVPTDEITSVPIDRKHSFAKLDQHRHHAHGDPRPHKNSDGFHSHAHTTPLAVYHDDYELHLPSGRTAGHRSLRAYYRQNLRNYPSMEERAEQRAIEAARPHHSSDDEEAPEHNGRGRQVISRANGGLGMIGVSDAKKREVRAVEKRLQKKEQRAQATYQWRNNKQANFQKHYRDPLLQ